MAKSNERVRKDPKERREELLTAGAKLAAKHGAENVTRKMVADATNTTDGLLNRYFGTAAKMRKAFATHAGKMGLKLPDAAKVEKIAEKRRKEVAAILSENLKVARAAKGKPAKKKGNAAPKSKKSASATKPAKPAAKKPTAKKAEKKSKVAAATTANDAAATSTKATRGVAKPKAKSNANAKNRAASPGTPKPKAPAKRVAKDEGVTQAQQTAASLPPPPMPATVETVKASPPPLVSVI